MSESPKEPQGKKRKAIEVEFDAETEEMILEMAELRKLSPEEYLKKLIVRDLAVSAQQRAIRLRGKRGK